MYKTEASRRAVASEGILLSNYRCFGVVFFVVTADTIRRLTQPSSVCDTGMVALSSNDVLHDRRK